MVSTEGAALKCWSTLGRAEDGTERTTMPRAGVLVPNHSKPKEWQLV